ncbi:MAG: hypothetical protein H7A05_06535 [Pseudomonadales bacterium]|nr:hypothetical protein [Pseudomonadales bacterium]
MRRAWGHQFIQRVLQHRAVTGMYWLARAQRSRSSSMSTLDRDMIRALRGEESSAAAP